MCHPDGLFSDERKNKMWTSQGHCYEKEFKICLIKRGEL